MKTGYIFWLTAALFALPIAGLAQAASAPAAAGSAAALPAAPGSYRPVLGGPPQLPIVPSAPCDTTVLALLRQLPLGAAGPLLPAAMVRVFAQGVRQLPSCPPQVAARATATAVAGSRLLVSLALPPRPAGVPAGGAAPGQRLKLLTASGEQFVTLARLAAAGSHTLVVSTEAKLAGHSVFVVGLEAPPAPAIDYEALAVLYGRATQQLAAVQQQLATLRHQLAAVQQLNGALLLDHAEQQDLRQQLRLLQSQQAATYSAARLRRGTGLWPVE